MAPKTEEPGASDSDDGFDDIIDASFDTLDRLIGEIPGHPPTDECPDAECMVCALRDCPYNEPLHYDGDGCPSCCAEDDS